MGKLRLSYVQRASERSQQSSIPIPLPVKSSEYGILPSNIGCPFPQFLSDTKLSVVVVLRSSHVPACLLFQGHVLVAPTSR